MIMKPHVSVSVLGLGLVLWLGASGNAVGLPLKVGDKAPLAEATDQNGQVWKMAEHLGKKVLLLYFYPKDETPGCTKEACGFRDQMEDLKKDGVEVVGVSMDSAESHQKFIAHHQLNFTLLADPEGKLATLYGTRMADRPMSRRVSFLIGLDGTIRHVTDSANADLHLSEMKAAVAKLPK